MVFVNVSCCLVHRFYASWLWNVVVWLACVWSSVYIISFTFISIVCSNNYINDTIKQTLLIKMNVFVLLLCIWHTYCQMYFDFITTTTDLSIANNLNDLILFIHHCIQYCWFYDIEPCTFIFILNSIAFFWFHFVGMHCLTIKTHINTCIYAKSVLKFTAYKFIITNWRLKNASFLCSISIFVPNLKSK